MPIVTNEPIQLSYFVANITGAVAEYNRLRWYRSRTGKSGLYEAATGGSAAAAQITGTSLTPHQVNAKTFSFEVNGVTTVSVTFSDPDPVTTAQVVTAINSATALVTASDVGGYLTLVTSATGSGASIEILDGDANPFLGFVEGNGAVGIDADTTLVGGTHEYFYTDNNSSEDFWYRVEFLHTGTGKTTGMGVAFSADQVTTVSKSQSLVAYIRLCDPSGNPVPCRRVCFSNVFIPNRIVDQTYNWGVFRHTVEMYTDRNGYAEIRLLRGMVLDLSIDGTNFVRRITVPSTGDSFDLLDPALVAEDEFGIQEQNVDYAIRIT